MISVSTTDTKRARGFTIVELLVVVLVIAILTTVIIVGYGAIRNSAKDNSLKTSLASQAKRIASIQSQGGTNTFPSAGAAGITNTPDVTFTYQTNFYATAFCLQATGWGLNYYVTTNNLSPQLGSCGYEVGTYSGTGTASQVNGAAATTATYNGPFGIAVDSNNTLYVTEVFGTDGVRKIDTTTNIVSAFVTGANFVDPAGIIVGSDGSSYVVGPNNKVIKVTAAGVSSTLAGSGSAGFNDATGASAQFNNPNGITIDSAGNLYVADTGNNRIRKVTPAGVVTTLAGGATASWVDNATGTTARFSGPKGITIDSSNGDLYVADTANNRIRKVTSAGATTTLAGQATPGTLDGTGTAAQFYAPSALILDIYSDIYVVDYSNQMIRKVTTAGVVTKIAGVAATNGFVDGEGSIAKFSFPRGITADSNGTVYVTDQSNNRIRKIVQRF